MYAGMGLSTSETAALKDLEAHLQQYGCLEAGRSIPVLAKDQFDIEAHKIGITVENNTVQALAVRYCAVPSLPESLGQLIGLRELDLTGSQLTTLPGTIGALAKLEKLVLDGNQLTSLPESVGKLTNLRFFLYISNNQLTTIPASLFEHLPYLMYLNITDNQLTALPDTIGSLTSLTELRLYNNQLAALPETIGELTTLK